ncbi:MAG: hypothetical protein ACE5DI_03695 [Candidatus Micrarchaeia archaeon]
MKKNNARARTRKKHKIARNFDKMLPIAAVAAVVIFIAVVLYANTPFFQQALLQKQPQATVVLPASDGVLTVFGNKVFLDEGYWIRLGSTASCEPLNRGSIELLVFSPSGQLFSSSKTWLGSLEFQTPSFDKTVSVVAINALSPKRVDEQCRRGLFKGVKNVSIKVS